MLPGSYPHRKYINIYGLYARKYQVEMRGDVTDAGQTNERATEDRGTQPMEAGG